MRRRERGGVLVESVMLVPILAGLMIGMYSLARITYTYYMLERVMYTLARYVGTQQAVNFCDPQDAIVAGAINYALTGDPNSSSPPIVTGLTPDMFNVRAESVDPQSQAPIACPCDATGCDATLGGLGPSFVSVSLTNGYPVTPIFWGFSPGQIILRPTVRLPYEGS